MARALTAFFGNTPHHQLATTLLLPFASHIMARYPVPSHILDAIDESDLSRYGAAHVSRRTENRRMIARAAEKINAIYDTGAPFFTKDAIREIVRQLDELTANIRLGDKALLIFTVQGLDGSFVEIPLELGVVLPYRDLPDVDIV